MTGTGTQMQTQTWATGVTTIALLVLRTGELKNNKWSFLYIIYIFWFAYNTVLSLLDHSNRHRGYAVIFLQFCLYGSWDSLGPEFMHPKLKLCIQPGMRGEIFCCVLDLSFELV